KRKKLLQALLFFVIGILLFWYVYRGVNLDQIKVVLTELKYSWILLSVTFGLLSQVVRTLRWKMLLDSMNYSSRKINLFLAVLILYFTNLIIPRGGEVARCGVVTRYEKIPFTKLLGTVFVERLTDLVAFFIIFVIFVFWQLGFVKELIDKTPELGFNFSSLSQKLILIAIVLLGSGILYFFLKRLGLFRKIATKLNSIKQNFLEGIATVKKLKHPGLYIVYSLVIFLFWLLMLYVVFFAYPPTAHLTFKIAIITYIVGTLAFLLPIQAGIGAWHFLVIQCLFLFGLDKESGMMFALVAHTFTNLIYLIFGTIAFIVLPLVNNQKEKII
ncbi:MAG: flippase-like domain-containing protein, partial [Bacteroidales bacterium]|nr:flippase-like domain-containing protein [Bacteroidales bacterium]